MLPIIQQCTLVITIFIQTILVTAAKDAKPNIIFILADDLGFNDVGFHGSNEIPTPNIDALAYSGVILNRYTMPSSGAASRSALMTGKYPIHTGMQHGNLYANETRGLSLNEKLMPEYFKDLGYATRMVGKWHLGHYRKEYTPTFRGFDSHLGFWTEYQDYFDHTSIQGKQWGHDMRRNMDIAYDLHGQYTTDIFTKEAVKIIHKHKQTKPLFLYVAHAAVHSGNPYNPLPALDEDVALFDSIENIYRRKYAAMVKKLDDSVGEIVNALKKKNLLAKSIIVFSTDNGGSIYIEDAKNKPHFNVASNWPLRGGKRSLFEGGVRGVGFIWSPFLSKRQRISTKPFDMTDWLPTLYHAAGGNITELRKDIDGIDSWNTLSEDKPTNRTEILHNIDDIDGTAALTVGDYKIVMGPDEPESISHWHSPADSNKEYKLTDITNSTVGKILSSMNMASLPKKIIELRNDAQLRRICPNITTTENNKCQLRKAPCLFNIKNDPCEFENLANKNLEIYVQLKRQLDEYKGSIVPPSNLDGDPRTNPQNHGHVWTYFDDIEFRNGNENIPLGKSASRNNNVMGKSAFGDNFTKKSDRMKKLHDHGWYSGAITKNTIQDKNRFPKNLKRQKITAIPEFPNDLSKDSDIHHHYFVFV
ncbi:arylsulfatase B-like [Chrysoperla carnea]|uniref:arylsulfatase B-like n=1 Tax=Chrysoperla carnea TaxID=189513 RepID=UPI001D074841|nr:arylsulfatase B-like [Chrysoperla carnea]